ncbi:MAG: serine protease [Niabella sp.]|nr:serine protease [Niabella sp.]
MNSCKKQEKIIDGAKPEDKLPTSAIVGGSYIDISNIPYQVRITAGTNGGGGVILGERWILTAAHVIDGKPLTAITVYAGSNSLNSGTSYGVDSVFTNNYVGVGDNDIALLKLSTPITFTSNVAPILYATSADYITTGEIGVASGWGQTSGTEDVSSLLKSASLKIYDLSNPKQIKAESITTPFESVCFGDSGGPFTIQTSRGRVLAGISSFFPVGDGASYSASCVQGKSGFTRVSAFADWIKEKTGIVSPGMNGWGLFCDEGSYSLDNILPGATFSWNVTPSGAVTFSGDNTATVTLSKANNYKGWISLSGVMTVPGLTTTTTTRSIWVGKPNIVIKQTKAVWNDPNMFYTVSADVTPSGYLAGIQEYNWTITDQNNNIYTMQTSLPYINFTEYVFQVQLDVTTYCGDISLRKKILLSNEGL